MKDSRSEGWEAGKKAGKAETIVSVLSEYGLVSADLSARITSEKDLDKLNQWIKIAIRVASVEEFIQKIDEIDYGGLS